MIKEIVGKKLGMTQVFDENANLVATTLIEVKPVCVLEKITYPKGVRARIGCFKIGEKRVAKVKKPVLGYFTKLGVAPYKLIKEVQVEDEEALELKKEVGIDIFSENTIVNVRAKSKGRGFQGGMKRHGWRGQPGSHGATSHRRLGSAGACTYPGKIIKGLHMPGHMGDCYVTIKNLKVLKIDKDKEVLFVKGAIPGAPNAVVFIKKVKR